MALMPEKSDPAKAARIKELEQNVADRKKALKDITNEGIADRKQREITALENQIQALKDQKP